MGVDPGLLKILVCPKCRGKLTVHGNDEALDCAACGLRYPVKKYGDDVWVPDMIIEHAERIGAEAGPGD